jgi:hypothetical protein
MYRIAFQPNQSFGVDLTAEVLKARNGLPNEIVYRIVRRPRGGKLC